MRGQVSNVVQGMPTDCPTREKHGWLGDAASIAEEAMFNFEMQGVFEEFLQTVADSQNGDGDVPGVVPVPHRDALRGPAPGKPVGGLGPGGHRTDIS